MKKERILILVSSLILILTFASSWYSAELLDSLFIFVLPIHFTLFISYIVCFISSINHIRKKNRIFFDCIPLIILIVNVIIITTFPFREAKFNLELVLLDNKRSQIIEKIKNGSLQSYDEYGNVELPRGYGHISVSKEVMIYQNDDNGIVIGFWIFRGILSSSAELIYSSNGAELIRANEGGHPIVEIEQLKKHWYYVETEY